jgi:hypothetical protein
VSPQFPALDESALVAIELDMIAYDRHDFEVRIAKQRSVTAAGPT